MFSFSPLVKKVVINKTNCFGLKTMNCLLFNKIKNNPNQYQSQFENIYSPSIIDTIKK